jgi:hypothetical protein
MQLITLFSIVIMVCDIAYAAKGSGVLILFSIYIVYTNMVIYSDVICYLQGLGLAQP